MKIDKQENFFWNKQKFEQVNKILEQEFANQHEKGMCHNVWARKKQLLKQMYNIDWKSPAELNPQIKFD